MSDGPTDKRVITTPDRLRALIKSARDIMRKDKGLNGDLDRLPMLTWIMFIKFLDDLEHIREEEAILRGEKFRAVIEAPYRWRDWAAKDDGITGDQLISFVNSDEATLPNGDRGLGLFAYLRQLEGADGDDRRDVVATVFKGTVNRMINGYLLRDVINKVSGIHFDSSDEIHTLGSLYESMLKEMRDAAGDSGEFYTPRPVVRFMVEQTAPTLGDVVYDPACGTGGFLVEAFRLMEAQCDTVEQRALLQHGSLLGGEAKPLPYLLAQMNLLLHGIESPEIDPGNSLRFPLRDIGEANRVDVILTNPPFGGEEEKGILANFPSDKRTAETAALFLQLIMRKLRRTTRSGNPGRCAMVVNDGFLSTRGVHSRIKQDLLQNFNLHTIVRLPRGVFAPYTPIKTNLLFFDSSTSTREVWFYELPPPVDRQMYTKTKPLPYEAFDAIRDWWVARSEGEFAWLVKAEELQQRDLDMDVPNPRRAPDAETVEPSEILRLAATTTGELAESLERLEASLGALPRVDARKHMGTVGDALSLRRDASTIQDDIEYQLVTVQLHGRGLRPRAKKYGREIKTKKQQFLEEGNLVVAEIDAKVGGFGIVPPELAGSIVSSHYFVYDVDQSKLDLGFLDWFLRSGIPEAAVQPFVKGSTNYAAIRPHHFPLLELPLPPVDEQGIFAARLSELAGSAGGLAQQLQLVRDEINSLVPAILHESYRPGDR